MSQSQRYVHQGRILRNVPDMPQRSLHQSTIVQLEKVLEEQNKVINNIAETIHQIRNKTLEEQKRNPIEDRTREYRRQKNEIKMLVELKQLRKKISQIEQGSQSILNPSLSSSFLPQIPPWGFPMQQQYQSFAYQYGQPPYYQNPYMSQGQYPQYNQFNGPQAQQMQDNINEQANLIDYSSSPQKQKAKLLQELVQQGKVVVVDNKSKATTKYQTPARTSQYHKTPTKTATKLPTLVATPLPEPEPQPKFTPEEIQNLRKILKRSFKFVVLVQTLPNYFRKIWAQKFQDHITKQPHNYKVFHAELEAWKVKFVEKFLVDAKPLLTKDWVFIGLTKVSSFFHLYLSQRKSQINV